MSTRQATLMMVLLALIALFLAVNLVQADPPPRAISTTLLAPGSGEVNYQGLLTDAAGNPLPDGGYNVTFALYNVAGGGGAALDGDPVSKHHKRPL